MRPGLNRVIVQMETPEEVKSGLIITPQAKVTARGKIVAVNEGSKYAVEDLILCPPGAGTTFHAGGRELRTLNEIDVLVVL